MEQENRDYGMLGRDAEMAVKAGLKSAEWYHSALSRKEMKELMKRSDEAAIHDTFVWLGAHACLRRLRHLALAFRVCGTAARGLWRPLRLRRRTAAGTNAATARRSRPHGRTMSIYQIACFMIMRNPVAWRWSHARHHTDTIIVGRDPEIITVMRPPDLIRVAA